MIVYVSPAERNGGILQFSVTMLRETLKIREKVLLFLPDSVPADEFPDVKAHIHFYPKVKTINGKSCKVKELAEKIAAQSPEKIIFLEDSVLMQQLNFLLKKKGFSTALTIHDVIRHPYHTMSSRQIAVEFLRQQHLKKTVRLHCTVLFLSDNSAELFRKRFPNIDISSVTMRLGAHIPEAGVCQPPEMQKEKNYLLFFGRIDKYKGIENLCRAYSLLTDGQKENLHLVIAGKGTFSGEEENLIRENPTIHVLHRFIEDGEMLWLVQNSKAVVLPYIEASQSGVLPIAYHFGKPVVVSNLPGLTENVENGKTAAIFDTVEHLTSILSAISDNRISFDASVISDYYSKYFNWKTNITMLLDQIP